LIKCHGKLNNNKVIKILFIMNTSGMVGGGQVSLLELLRLLDRKLFSPCAIVGGPGEMQALLQNIGIQCSVVPLPRISASNFFRSLGSIAALRRFIKANKIEVVHSNDSRAHLYAGIASRLAMVPSVFHFRVSDSDGWYDNVLPRLATRIVAVSNATGRRFNRFQGKLDVIHNGVDTERFSPGIVSAAGLPLPKHHSPLIGTVGRVGRQKGINVLIHAVEILKREFPELGVVVAGKDEQGEEGDMKKLCNKHGLGNHILFLDQCNDMPGFMRTIDLYVLLSDNEGFNRSILEAMACGKPVVATNVGGNPEIVNDQIGKLIPYGNVDAAVESIRTFLSDKRLASAAGTNGRLLVEKQFNINLHVRQMSSLFTRCAEGSRFSLGPSAAGQDGL
jgi:glycosyltransferase involved in cell wall biosynthesis